MAGGKGVYGERWGPTFIPRLTRLGRSALRASVRGWGGKVRLTEPDEPIMERLSLDNVCRARSTSEGIEVRERDRAAHA